jgi:hypothetical protein
MFLCLKFSNTLILFQTLNVKNTSHVDLLITATRKTNIDKINCRGAIEDSGISKVQLLHTSSHNWNCKVEDS